MADVSDLREAARPHAPRIEGVTEEQRRRGRHLALIHGFHLRDIARIRAFVAHIDSDPEAAGKLAAAVDDMEMTRNLRAFGAVCGQECGSLLFHHGAEEQQVFPLLDRVGGEGLRAVVRKLREEHEVVHALLDELAAGARAIEAAPGPETYAALRDCFGRLEAVLRSHFGYEETELEEALGVHVIL